jgi:hypothetical protein
MTVTGTGKSDLHNKIYVYAFSVNRSVHPQKLIDGMSLAFNFASAV